MNDAALDARVFAENVKGLFSKGLLPYFTNVINASIVAFVLRDVTDRQRLFAWLAAVVALTAARIGLHAAYRRRAEPDARRWGRRFTIGAALAGAMWGIGGSGLYPEGAIGPQMLLMFVVGGMCAGSAASMASHAPAFAAFAAPAVVPTVARLAASRDELHLAMAAMLTLFGVAMTMIARSGGKSLAEATRLRFVNAALAGDLDQARATLETRVRKRSKELEAAIAERRVAEEALAVSERLAQVGALAASVAHEINNPLSFVLANQTFVRERVGGLIDILERDEELKPAAEILREALEALADAQTGAERVRDTVGDLKAFSRTADDARHPIEVAPVIERAIRLAQSQCHDRARVETELGPAPRVLANEARLGQAFLQLIINAAQAAPRGAPKNVVRVVTKTDAEGHAVVEVHDRGAGIAPEVVPRIFEPFFTTNSPGQAGLGLSICHGIVASLGGHIQVESQPGQGSTFRVVLPAASA